MRITEAFDYYRDNYMVVKGYSRRVVENHDYVKRRLAAELGDKKIERLTIDDIGRWAKTLRTRTLSNGEIVERSPNSVRCDIQRLRGVIKYMNIIGVKCLNYQLVIVPKNKTVERCFLYEEEVQEMIDNAYSLRNQFIISLLYSSGIRLSELLSLDRDSIIGRTFTVIGKGDKERICFIDKRTEELMEEYLATRDDESPALIISDIYKDRMSPSNVQLIIRNSARRAGIEKHVTPHILRHSFATNFVRNNGGVRPLSKLLGHASLNTTMVYTHIEDHELKQIYNRYHTV